MVPLKYCTYDCSAIRHTRKSRQIGGANHLSNLLQVSSNNSFNASATFQLPSVQLFPETQVGAHVTLNSKVGVANEITAILRRLVVANSGLRVEDTRPIGD